MAQLKKITFEGTDGNLAGSLELPGGTPKAFALFAHCFTCSKDVFAAKRIASGLTEAGIAVLRFDFTGLGNSEGDFANTHFSSNVEDLLKAANFLRENYQAPEILIGHSLGGAAVLSGAGEIPEAKVVVTIGAPFDPGHVVHNFGGQIEEIKKEGIAEVTLAGRKFTIKKEFLEDLESQDVGLKIKNLRKALLIFHAPEDSYVGIENAGNIFQAAKHPKSFVSLFGADHLLTKKADANYVAEVIATWAGRYIEGNAPAHPETSLQLADGDTLVMENGKGKFSQYVNSAGHILVADEPQSVGGENSGPTPYDFLLTALGACSTMTMRIYADFKKLPLERVAVKLSHQKIHAEDCADCETKGGKLDEIFKEIEIIGDDLTEENRQSIKAIASKCPVHRTLLSEVKIRTKLMN
ncbi:MAG: bifunctional alpha/beta hydrolase/OsmC family protein [Sphingomonadales bacterium]